MLLLITLPVSKAVLSWFPCTGFAEFLVYAGSTAVSFVLLTIAAIIVALLGSLLTHLVVWLFSPKPKQNNAPADIGDDILPSPEVPDGDSNLSTSGQLDSPEGPAFETSLDDELPPWPCD
jgi:hypothetical protein